MTPRLPVGVLGVGALGQHHARHLAGLSDVRLVGVHDMDRGRAKKIAAELGTVAFADMDRAPGPGGGGHRRRADTGPRRGRTPSAESWRPGSHGEAAGGDADRSRRPDRRGQPPAGSSFRSGHIERYNRAIRAAEPYLDGPRYIESLRLAPFQPRGTDVAVVLDLMIHDLDLVLHLTGSVATEVRASGLPVLSPHLDIANARVEFANGAVALATASRVARERVRRLRLFQPNGYFSLDLATGVGEFMRLRAGWQPGTGRELADVVERIELEAPEADALSLELQSFVHAVRGEREVVVRGEEGRAALELALRVADAVRTIAPRGRHALMIQRGAPRIFISAGEPSGDLHGAGVVRALQARYPNATIEALGGPADGSGRRHVALSDGGARRVWAGRSGHQDPGPLSAAAGSPE